MTEKRAWIRNCRQILAARKNVAIVVGVTLSEGFLMFTCTDVDAVFAAADTSTRDRLLSLFHAANRKLRLRDKSKSVDNDAFVPSMTSRSKSTTLVHRLPNAADADLLQSRVADCTAEQAVSIRRYPAYHFDANRNAVSLTENCKSSLMMRRIARSYESLSSVRTCVPENSSRAGNTLPLAYRSVNS